MIQRIDFSDPHWSLTRSGDDAFSMQVIACARQWMSNSTTLQITTSGTTGEPRRLDIPKEWVIQSTLRTMNALGLSEGFHAHLCLPLDFIAGKMVVWRTMIAHGILTWETPSSSPSLGSTERADIASVTPHQLHALLSNFTGQTWPVHKLLVGGGPVSEVLRNRMANESITCYETYGMAESISHIALRLLGHAEAWFCPMQDVVLSVDDRSCLNIRIPYFDQWEIQTQDVVELKPTGEFRWLGRADWVINSGGIKLFPERIEERLASLIPFPFVIHGIQDEILGSKAVVFIESAPWTSEETEHLQVKMKELLPELERPREVRFISSFQRTSSGKIKRHVLI